MIRNTDAFVTKVPGIFHDRFRRTYTVHFRHIGMHMHLNALFLGWIRDRFHFDFFHLHRIKRQIFGKGIIYNRTINDIPLSLFQS